MCLSVGRSVGQMAGRAEIDGRDTPHHTTDLTSCVVTFIPPSPAPPRVCVCIHCVCMDVYQHCGTHTHTETLRQSDRGKPRHQGTHRIPIRWPTQKLAPPIMMYISPASQLIATQSVSQTVAHRRLLDSWLPSSQPPLPACVCVCVCRYCWMDGCHHCGTHTYLHTCHETTHHTHYKTYQ